MPFSLLSFGLAAQLLYSIHAGRVPAHGTKVNYFDVQGHRGTRGEAVESTIPAFSWGMMDGVTTLELDNVITKDGVVIIWHDDVINSVNCQDTCPATPNDPEFPYVGKAIANLTLKQIKTLDCGSKRLSGFPLALTYPGTSITTLDELFSFARCVDPERNLRFNVEAKIIALNTNAAQVESLVQKQYQVFKKSGYPLSNILYQSFDWRALIHMKKIDPKVPTSALIVDQTMYGPGNSTSPWLGGIDLALQPGDSPGAKIAHAAKAIKADVLSSIAVSTSSQAEDPTGQGYVPFTTKEMISTAHNLGLLVTPWTVNHLNVVEQLIEWGVDGIITDYPEQVRRFAELKGKKVAPKVSVERVRKCL